MDTSGVGCSMVYCRSLVSPLMWRRNSLACCLSIKCPNFFSISVILNTRWTIDMTFQIMT